MDPGPTLKPIDACGEGDELRGMVRMPTKSPPPAKMNATVEMLPCVFASSPFDAKSDEHDLPLQALLRSLTVESDAMPVALPTMRPTPAIEKPVTESAKLPDVVGWDGSAGGGGGGGGGSVGDGGERSSLKREVAAPVAPRARLIRA